VSATSWITTFSGKTFNVLEPRAEDVCIEDIAHALSMQCRFTGHVRHFYSVAQHSILVSMLCPQEYALWGLLHDASEAYIGDMSAPLKHTPEMARYRTTEKRIMAAVVSRFGLEPKEPLAVKDTDRRLLLAEARDMGLDVTGWYSEHKPFDQHIRPMSPEMAEFEFLYRFKELTK
jgi:hypothetical protein